MKFAKTVIDGYINCICKGDVHGIEISEEEYNHITNAIHGKPTDPEGYCYRLKTDLTWELYELPPMPPVEEDATEEDYIEALNELGVKTDEA